nr:uncharacterized protein LOC117600707 isoform X2 [Osmia lignaria]
MLRHMLRPIVQNTRMGARSYHVPHDVRPPHMDEVLVPSGSWQEAYTKANRKYNLVLALGITSLLVTIAIGRWNGTLWLNFAPPKPKPKE